MVDPLMAELAQAPAPDAVSGAAVERRAAEVLRPLGALERLDEVAVWLASWQRTERPSVQSPAVIVFAAEHGVAERGVSAYPSGVTAEMLRCLRDGVATASVIAREVGARIDVIDVGVGWPTSDLSREAALSEQRFAYCIEMGRSAVRALSHCDVLVLGEMGIGNTTSAAAICAALFGLPARDWVGRGTGLDESTLTHKVRVVEEAVRRLPDELPPLEVLRELGGAELVAIAGAAVEARLQSIPVILDGFVVTAAVMALALTDARAVENCLAGHCSSEPGHRLLLDKLGKRPLLDLDLRLGEGSGALLALPLVRLAAACVTEVATFAEARVPGRP